VLDGDAWRAPSGREPSGGRLALPEKEPSHGQGQQEGQGSAQAEGGAQCQTQIQRLPALAETRPSRRPGTPGQQAEEVGVGGVTPAIRRAVRLRAIQQGRLRTSLRKGRSVSHLWHCRAAPRGVVAADCP